MLKHSYIYIAIPTNVFYSNENGESIDASLQGDGLWWC